MRIDSVLISDPVVNSDPALNSDPVLIQAEVRNHKNGKNDAGDPVSGHKGKIDPAEIIGPDNSVLVDQHAHERGHPAPIPPPKASIKPDSHHTKRTQRMEKFRDMQRFLLA